MKKILLILVVLLTMPTQAFAYTLVSSNTYYVPYLDEYRMDYTRISAASYQLYFVSPSSVVFTGDYDFAPTGVHYLTCNGTYKLKFFDGATTLIGETAEHVISGIVSPTCTSYADGISGKNDLNARSDLGSGVSYDLAWDDLPGAASYEIWKDGILDGTTTDTNYNLPSAGSVSIVAKDSSGDIIGESDLMVPDPSSCGVCEKLRKLLECPDWDLYMGELSAAIKNGLPTLPEWRAIADQFTDSLEDYFGEIPDAPSQAEIESSIVKPMPTMDITTVAENLVPSVPAGFESPKPFDITSGPQIEIVDESVPFEIFNPLNNIVFDEPGVPVIPGDARNNTGGITKPTTTSYPIVTPKPMSSTLPNNPIPKPSSTNGAGPTPGGTGGAGPIPSYPSWGG